MNTQDQDILLLDYIEGDATPEQITQVERLLAADPALKQRVKAMQAQRNLLRAVHETNLPASRVQDAITQAQSVSSASPTATHWVYRWQPWAIAACLALTAGVLWLVIPDRVEPLGDMRLSSMHDSQGTFNDAAPSPRMRQTQAAKSSLRNFDNEASAPAIRALETDRADDNMAMALMDETTASADMPTQQAASLQRVQVNIVTDNPAQARLDVQQWIDQQHAPERPLADTSNELILVQNETQVNMLLAHLNRQRLNQHAGFASPDIAKMTHEPTRSLHKTPPTEYQHTDTSDAAIIAVELNYMLRAESE